MRKHYCPILILINYNGNRAVRADAGVFQGLDDFEAGEDAVVAVADAAGADGVDVRANHDRWQVGCAGIDAGNVADFINADAHAERLHFADDVIAAEFVFGDRGKAAATAAGQGTEFAECEQVVQQAFAVDTQFFAHV